MNKIRFRFFSLMGLGLLILAQGCKKDKTDLRQDNRVLTVNRANSNVRIINLAGFNQVKANGDSLTSFVVKNPFTADGLKYPGTSYFPTDGKLGKTWFVPQDIFKANETAEFDFGLRTYQASGMADIKMTAKNDYNNPTDYYLLPTFFMTGQPAVVPVNRGVSVPSKPDHFKIRIVNLTGSINSPGSNPSGPLENLAGSVSLAFADGTLVNTATSNVSAAQRTSEYIEVPYGTYQFKVLSANGRQLPASGGDLYDYTIIDPPTSTMPVSLSQNTGLTFAPIQTYQPGGIYTIVVAPQNFKVIMDELNNSTDSYQNSFQIVNDNSAAANNTYFRIQGANAFDNQPVSFRLDGKTIATNISFGTSSDYHIQVHGSHLVEAIDASGKVIASASQTLRPSQNYTAWVYADPNGQGKLLLVANDLSGSGYTAAQEDASFSRWQFKFPFYKRFLNLSVGNPYITFTLNNGQTSSGINNNPNAGVNMQPGLPLYEQPYTNSTYNQAAFDIMAYRSKPNVVPGVWASDIEVLKNESFIANKALYTNVSRMLPVQEAGIYTVALIGATGTNVPVAKKARMMIVKHNK